jgi:hypothetical protein
MKTTNLKIELLGKISYLKEKKEADLVNLKEQYNDTVESFSPLNLIKSVTQEFCSSPDLKPNLINAVIGFGANYLSNYLSKKILNEDANNPVQRLLGKLLKFGLKMVNR